MKKLFFIILSLAAVGSKAQVLSYDFYTFRLNNMFNVNPAYAGKGNGLNLVASAQSQNRGVAFNNNNFMLGGFSKISTKQALGGKIISDKRGAFQMIRADLTYAYIVKIAETSSLSFGLSAGVLNNNFAISRIENYQALDQTDPTLTQSNNSTQFVAGVGLLYNYKDLEVSVSLPHILATNQPVNSYVNTAVFYNIKVKEKFKLIPWFCYQSIPVTKNLFFGHLKAMYNDKIWVQAGYQTNRTVNAAVGVNIENLSLIYGFRFSNRQFADITSGSHEVSILFTIPARKNIATSNPIPIPIPIPVTINTTNNSLNDILNRLDKLLSDPVTSLNKNNINNELEKIKQQLQTTEIDNSTPEKAEEVAKQLLQIDEKLKLIEKQMSNE